MRVSSSNSLQFPQDWDSWCTGPSIPWRRFQLATLTPITPHWVWECSGCARLRRTRWVPIRDVTIGCWCAPLVAGIGRLFTRRLLWLCCSSGTSFGLSITRSGFRVSGPAGPLNLWNLLSVAARASKVPLFNGLYVPIIFLLFPEASRPSLLWGI